MLKVTQFAQIDAAMIRVVKAAAFYEGAIYTAGERDAMDNVLKEATGLKDAFVKVSKAVNAQYEEQEARQDEATRGGEWLRATNRECKKHGGEV